MAVPHFRGHIRKITTPAGVSWIGEYRSRACNEVRETTTRAEAFTQLEAVAAELLATHARLGEGPELAKELPILRLAA